MQVLQSTIERLLYILLLMMFVAQVATFVKLSADDSRKFKVLKDNQGTLICIVKGPTSLSTATQSQRNAFIDNCVKVNQKE